MGKEEKFKCKKSPKYKFGVCNVLKKLNGDAKRAYDFDHDKEIFVSAEEKQVLLKHGWAIFEEPKKETKEVTNG